MKKLFVFFTFLFLVFSAHPVYAAELNLSPSSGSYSVGETIRVRIVLSSANQSANAVSSSISFPSDLLTLTSISKTGSLISLWALEPTYSNAGGTANTEGVILNGYTGSNGTVATLSFTAKAVGSANIKFSSSSVLANDGQGTDILTSTGQANFKITKATEKASAPPATSSQVTPSVQIEELKKIDVISASSKFLITGVGKKTKSSYKIEIDGLSYPWDNQDSGIFTTPPLPKGTHSIKVSMTTVDNDTISSSASFSVDSILVPVLTDYSKDINENEYIVVKGLADPNINIVINSNRILPEGGDAVNEIVTIKSDEKGLFTYISNSRVVAGVYIITAQARTDSGIESEKSLPVKISVSTKTISISTNIMNTLSMMIPIIGLLILFILLLIWGWYRILHYRENMRKRLIHTKAIVAKSFNILDEDAEVQLKIFKKIKAQQPLTSEERVFINQFKKDIESAEKTIIDDIKE